ncbi:MAG: metal-dependent hydrolase [Nitrospirota bacterium]
MDPLTHGLAGLTINNLGFKRKATLWVLLLSSIAPDFDYITRFWGMDVFLRYHRGITHGFLALLIVPIIIGLLFGYRKGFFYYYFIAFLGYAAHLFMDLTNQYGTRILSPLDWQQYSLDLIFILDPYITMGLLLSVILTRANKKRAAAVASITIILLIAYMGGRYYLRVKSGDFLKGRLEANTFRMCPLPNDFLRWWFITQSGKEIKVGFADLFTRRICVQEIYSMEQGDPYIEKSKDTRVIKNFLYFARYPYAEVKRDSDRITVIWRELSYSFIAGDHFVAKVIFDEKGRIEKSYFKF